MFPASVTFDIWRFLVFTSEVIRKERRHTCTCVVLNCFIPRVAKQLIQYPMKFLVMSVRVVSSRAKENGNIQTNEKRLIVTFGVRR